MIIDYSVEIGKPDLKIGEIIDFLLVTYSTSKENAREAKEALITTEPSFSPRNFIIARSSQNKLIGVVRIVERNIRLGSIILFCGGISSVGVHSQWRRKGVCRSMMKYAIEEMTRRGMDITFLHARRALDGYYRQFGYYGINRYLDLEIVSSMPQTNDLEVRTFSRKDLMAIMSAYDHEYSKLSGSVMRDEKYWNYLLDKIDASGGKLKLMCCFFARNREIIGYIVFFDEKLVELALPGSLFGELPALLNRLGIKDISIHPCHPFHKYVRNSFSTIKHERFSLDGGYQGMILNANSLLSKIYPDLLKRSRSVCSGLCQAVIFGHELGFPNPDMRQSPRPNDITFEQGGQDIRLILGMQYPEEYFGININPEKPWLLNLFPYTGFHTSYLDEV